jgi:hypothetical protein
MLNRFFSLIALAALSAFTYGNPGDTPLAKGGSFSMDAPSGPLPVGCGGKCRAAISDGGVITAPGGEPPKCGGGKCRAAISDSGVKAIAQGSGGGGEPPKGCGGRCRAAISDGGVKAMAQGSGPPGNPPHCGGNCNQRSLTAA